MVSTVHPLRVIIGSPGTITSGIENYLFKILSKLANDIKYSISSVGQFKDKFIAIRDEITDDFCFWSGDVCSMFPSINIDKSIDIIMDKLYKSPQLYFEEEELNDGHISYFPDKGTFRTVLTNTLKYFTSFQTESKFYKQKGGTAMGSKLAGLVSNIFMDFHEREFFDHEVKKGSIKLVFRYVDDYLFLTRRSDKKRIFNCLNKFDPGIKLTCEDMSHDHKLPFLDTCIQLHNGKYQLFFYEKPGKSDILQNFSSSVTPLNQRISLLTGEIYRRNNTTSCEHALNLALNQLTQRFLKNNYPLHLIKRKISEIRKLKFQPLTRDDSDVIQKFFLSLDYTSERCYKIGLSIQKVFKKFAPKFRVIVSWKTIRISRILGKFLKKQPQKFEINDAIYSWTCPCSSKYIGQTKRQVGIRWQEHVASSNSKKTNPPSIFKHIHTCKTFQEHYSSFLNAPGIKNFTYLEKTKKAQTQYALLFFHGNKKPPDPKKFTINDFALRYFDIMHTNLTKYSQRTDIEAFLILLNQPSLNEQKDFKTFKTFI